MENIRNVFKDIQVDLSEVEKVRNNEQQLSSQFIYGYLNKMLTNNSFSRIFEVNGDEDYFYILA